MSKDPRDIATSNFRLGEGPAEESVTEGGPDDATYPSLEAVSLAQVAQSEWRLNTLGIVLVTALVCTVLVALVLGIKLVRTRAELAEAESAAEVAEAAVAREPAESAEPAEPAEPAPVEGAGAPSAAPAEVPPAPARAAPAPDQPVRASPARVEESAARATDERLVLLLSVGTRHFAEKQLRRLKRQCAAPLAIYRQIRGRCAFSQCFAVAAPSADAGLARGCGQVKGQSLRDRADFTVP